VPRGSDDRPHYLALRDQIVSAIDLGKLPAGARLPSERQMQTDTGTARGTIREALSQLEAEGMIYRRDRSGWYVSPPPVAYDLTRWAAFMTYVVEQRQVPTTETLATESVAAPSTVADIFRRAPRHTAAPADASPLDRRAGGADRTDHGRSRARAGTGNA